MQRPTIKWRLKVLLAERDIDTATDLQRRLREIGIEISAVQLSRIIKEAPARLNMEVLYGLITVLQCDIGDLIHVEWPEGSDPGQKVKSIPRSTEAGGQEIGTAKAKRGRKKARSSVAKKDDEDASVLGPKATAFPVSLEKK